MPHTVIPPLQRIFVEFPGPTWVASHSRPPLIPTSADTRAIGKARRVGEGPRVRSTARSAEKSKDEIDLARCAALEMDLDL